jgi:hypothetical protein
VLGDRGYDAAAIRHGLRARHILPLTKRFSHSAVCGFARQSLRQNWMTA